MDFEENQKRQTIRVILTETLMVFAVIALVGVLVMIVSGYWIDQDLTIKRQGLLQISSAPTNATFAVDGETSLFSKTNSSKMVTTGDHLVSVSKEGYDTWTKNVNIKEGLLYRLHYPRLFLLERDAEKVLEIKNINASTISPNRELLLVMNNTTNWSMYNLNNHDLKGTVVDVKNVFPNTIITKNANSGLINDEILSYVWNNDSSKILFEVMNNSKRAWVMLDLRNPEKSTNISEVFGLNISMVKMFDDSGDNLLIVEDGNLRRLNVPTQSISHILAKNVTSYDYFENEIVYVSKNNDGVVVGNLKNMDSDAVEFLQLDGNGARVALNLFYENKYLTVENEGRIIVYKWKTPTSMNEDDGLEIILEQQIGFVPDIIKCGHNGEFIMFNRDNKIATLDMESISILEYEVETNKFGWLDEDMIYVVGGDHNLIVYDYDGLNRRELAKNVSSHYSVVVSKNEKWLYYFSDNYLIRENLLPS